MKEISMLTVAAETSDAQLPAPRRAAEELPDLERAHELGIEIDDLETARAVACLLSRFLARGRSRNRTNVKAMMIALATACSVEVVHDGEADPASHPELEAVTWPNASTAFRRFGIDASTLTTYWREARNRSSDACFPIEWLLAFYPAAIWPAVATLMAWGPERTRVRLEQTAMALAKRKTVKERRRRSKGSPLALSTVDAWVSALMGLLEELVGLRSTLKVSRQPALPLELVDTWAAKPPRPNLREAGAQRSGQDNSGPPLEEVRRTLHELTRDYESNRKYPYLRLRRLLLLSILALLGPRQDTVRTARVADFKPDAVGPDGTRRSVLEIRPGKTWEADEVHVLPLPRLVAEWLREWIRITKRELGDPGPLFPSKMPKPGIEARPLTYVGFYGAIAGRDVADGGTRALIPLDGDPYLGHRPHAYRHAAAQLIQRAAVEVKVENPGAFDHLTPEDFSRAVLGHTLTRSTPDVYRDLDRRRLTFAVVDKAWEILWGEEIVRKGLDPHAIAKNRDRVRSLRSAIGALDRDLHRLRRSQQTLRERARAISGDDLARALIEGHATAAEIEELALQRERLSAQLVAAEEEYEDARTRLVALPEDMSDEEHARLLAEALGTDENANLQLEGPLAEYLTSRDLAGVWGTTEQTINRWARDGFPTGRSAPWDNAAWIVDGPRRKRLPAAALDPALLTEAQKIRLIEVRRRSALQSPQMVANPWFSAETTNRQ
jgi:integrase